MNDYEQTLAIAASPAAVHAALTSIAGLRAWWTDDCEGDAAPDGSFTVRFGETEKTMRVEDAGSPSEVRWTCTHAHLDLGPAARTDEWVGTIIVFRIEPDAGQGARLDFAHLGLTPALACHAVCSAGWQQFLGSLRAYLETGSGAPFRDPALHERSAA